MDNATLPVRNQLPAVMDLQEYQRLGRNVLHSIWCRQIKPCEELGGVVGYDLSFEASVYNAALVFPKGLEDREVHDVPVEKSEKELSFIKSEYEHIDQEKVDEISSASYCYMLESVVMLEKSASKKAEVTQGMRTSLLAVVVAIACAKSPGLRVLAYNCLIKFFNGPVWKEHDQAIIQLTLNMLNESETKAVKTGVRLVLGFISLGYARADDKGCKNAAEYMRTNVMPVLASQKRYADALRILCVVYLRHYEKQIQSSQNVQGSLEEGKQYFQSVIKELDEGR